MNTRPQSASTTTLWRPTGPEELALVAAADWRAWPPRLPEQPIFYPVLNADYAVRIARDWNVPASGVGYVTRFEVDSAFLDRYPVRQAGGSTILELWVPADELPEFNAHIAGRIEVVRAFGPNGEFPPEDTAAGAVPGPGHASAPHGGPGSDASRSGPRRP